MLVSVAVSVAVWVGNVIGVNVAVGVVLDKGCGVAVHVGITAGVKDIIRFNPPHETRSRASADVPIQSLFVIVS